MQSSINKGFVTDSDTIKQALKGYTAMTDKEQQEKALEIVQIISRFTVGGLENESREFRGLAERKE